MAEETGFIGVLVILLLYMFLLLRLVQNAQWAKDRSGMYIVMGVAAVLGVHVFVNVGMMIGYVPVTGIPLPLMSAAASIVAKDWRDRLFQGQGPKFRRSSAIAAAVSVSSDLHVGKYTDRCGP